MAPIKAGVIVKSPPFVINEDHNFRGISVDLWKAIAYVENIPYTLIPLPENIDNALQQLKSGQIDIVIGPTSATYERFKLVDFSRPYFLSQIGVVQHIKRTDLNQLLNIFWEVLTSPFILGFFAYFFLYIIALWLFEKSKNEEIPKSFWEGISFVAWLHVQKYKTWDLPRSIPGRIAAIVWLFSAGLLITSITAAVTSKFTLALAFHPQQFNQPSDLENHKVAAIHGTLSAEEARKLGAKVFYADHIEQEMTWLAQNKVEAIVTDYIIAKNYLVTHPDLQFQLANFTLANKSFAFPVRKGSPLLDKVDAAILLLQDNHTSVNLCQKYVSKENAADCTL